jgi:hypothetical protein
MLKYTKKCNTNTNKTLLNTYPKRCIYRSCSTTNPLNCVYIYSYVYLYTTLRDIVIGISEQHSDVKWTITVTHSTVVIFNVVLLLLVMWSGKVPILNIFLQVGLHYPTGSAVTGCYTSSANLILSDRKCRFWYVWVLLTMQSKWRCFLWEYIWALKLSPLISEVSQPWMLIL